MFSLPAKLKVTQFIPISLDEAWEFFSKPKNLQAITPEYMGFVVHTPEDELDEMYPGQIINYTVSPVAGIPIKWTTEITHVRDNRFFVDEQRFGPYTLWHHQHHFKPVEGGVEMTDIVHYKLPLGPFGWMARKIFVERQLKGIFSFRYEKIKEMWPERELVS